MPLVERKAAPTGMTLAGKTTNTRNDGGRVMAIAHKNVSYTVLDDFNHTFGVANVTRIKDGFAKTTDFVYDANGRPT